jgi:protein-disulfide isomerase
MFEAEPATLALAVSPRDHAEGPENAAVTLVEYGDYECPHCGRAYPILKRIQERLGLRLRFIFRNFPLSQVHPHAQHAAEAAEAAAAQGYFWEMHDTLFLHQRALTDRYLHEYASTIGMDPARFRQELADHRYAGRVRDDFLSGVHSGVNGTPTFFINGSRHDDAWDFETLLRALEAAAVVRSPFETRMEAR